MISRINPIAFSALALAALVGTGAAQAQVGADAYPQRPVRLVIGFPPGGGNDIIARFIASRLVPRLGQQLVIDNRGGAAGVIGAEIVARAAPDGYTLLFTSVSHTMLEATRALPYDTVKSFAPVAMFGRGPNVLLVHPAVAAKSLQELIALAKKKPGALNYASTGTAGMHHFGGELFKRSAGIELTHVPFKGGGPAAVAVMSGEVQVMFSTLPLAMPMIRSGKARPLGVGATARTPLLPDVPTLAEAGAPGYEFTVWWGVVAPARTPAAIVGKLNTEINAVLAAPDVAKQLAAEGAEVTVWTPARFGEFLAANVQRWKRVARDANITAE